MQPQVHASDLPEIISRNPATGEELGRAPLASASEVFQAVKFARTAQPSWAKLSYSQRARVILKAREFVLTNLESIATLISQETGKPRAEAISMELVPALDLMHYFATNTAKLLRSSRIDIG
ncbi:MAG TPA: aldehyde dehydrogenase family protein, partial [Pyrinomonadaceae bacterium]|nr:aldehyde dehydrogenase family protein [Pyrinomonadaceae bacterium]